MVMRNGKPDSNSGKTFYNRIKQPGQSWTKLRDEARKKQKLNGRGYELDNSKQEG